MDFRKERSIWISVTAILVIALVFLGLRPGFLPFAGSISYNISTMYESIKEYVDNDYYTKPPTEEELMTGALKGMVQALKDPYSGYFTPSEFKSRMGDLSGEFGGIGAYIGLRDEYPVILKPMPGLPAAKAGLQSGDKIIYVDDVSVIGINFYDIIAMIKGKVGTKVKLTILREGHLNPLEFIIERALVKVEFVKSGKIDNDIYYIKIEDFGENVSKTIKEELRKASRTKGLVVDIRGNPGGYLEEVLNILEYFFEDKVLVTTDGRNDDYDREFKAGNKKMFDDKIPIAILVDGNSASASEIFTGVMKDYKRAVVFGEKTFGKGLVQQIFQLPNNSGLFLTISQYYTPNKYQINGNGITPDIEIKNFDLTDEDKLKIAFINNAKIIKEFVQKNGDNYSVKAFTALKTNLKKQALLVDDVILKKMIYDEIHTNDVDDLFSLEFDKVLRTAVEYLKSKK